jgi:hypothetical protein
MQNLTSPSTLLPVNMILQFYRLIYLFIDMLHFKSEKNAYAINRLFATVAESYKVIGHDDILLRCLKSMSKYPYETEILVRCNILTYSMETQPPINPLHVIVGSSWHTM